MQTFRTQKHHRASILNPSLTKIGASQGVGSIDSKTDTFHQSYFLLENDVEGEAKIYFLLLVPEDFGVLSLYMDGRRRETDSQ